MVTPWHWLEATVAGVSEVSYPDAYSEPPAMASHQPKVGTRERSTPLDTALLSVYPAIDSAPYARGSTHSVKSGCGRQ